MLMRRIALETTLFKVVFVGGGGGVVGAVCVCVWRGRFNNFIQ